jgi:hypothetical protein
MHRFFLINSAYTVNTFQDTFTHYDAKFISLEAYGSDPLNFHRVWYSVSHGTAQFFKECLLSFERFPLASHLVQHITWCVGHSYMLVGRMNPGKSFVDMRG